MMVVFARSGAGRRLARFAGSRFEPPTRDGRRARRADRVNDVLIPVHLQKFPLSQARMRSSLGCGSRRSSSSELMIMPGVQKPHCSA